MWVCDVSLKDAVLSPAQCWNADDAVILKIDFLIVRRDSPDEGYHCHLTLGYASYQDDDPSTWMLWKTHLAKEEFRTVLQSIRETFEGKLIDEISFPHHTAHLAWECHRILIDSLHPELLRDFRAEVCRALRLGIVGGQHPKLMNKVLAKLHLSVAGVVERVIFDV